MANTITARVAQEVIAHEAIVREAYKDSVGVWTWSVGLTAASGERVTNFIDNPQPLAVCLDAFTKALRTRYAPKVDDVFAGHALTEAQFAAALSFHYNTGGIGRASWPKLWKDGNTDAARASIMEWRKPAEIIPRRAKERDLFFDGVWSSDGRSTVYPVRKPSYQPDFGRAQKVAVLADLETLLNAKPGEGTRPKQHVITTRIIQELIRHEGLVREAYKNSEGVWKWSAGLTDASGHNVQPYIDNPQTFKRCIEVFEWALRTKYAPKVDEVFADHELTEAQFAAALCFQLDTSRIHLAAWPSLWKQGDIAGARAAMMSWDGSTDLTARRQEESELFFDQAWCDDLRSPTYQVNKPSYLPNLANPRMIDTSAIITQILATVAAEQG